MRVTAQSDSQMEGLQGDSGYPKSSSSGEWREQETGIAPFPQNISLQGDDQNGPWHGMRHEPFCKTKYK